MVAIVGPPKTHVPDSRAKLAELYQRAILGPRTSLKPFPGPIGPAKTPLTATSKWAVIMSCLLMPDHENVKHPTTALWHEAPEIFRFTDEASAQSIFEARAGYLKKGSTQPTIPIRKPGSEVLYAVDLGSFPATASAEIVGRALDNAATQWNDREAGATFRRAAANNHSAFVLRCAIGPADVLARAFFADADDRTLYVYALAFLELSPDNMTRVFLHELGHILGLRHEFAGTVWAVCFFLLV